VQYSQFGFWCRLRGSASFISPLSWTEGRPKPFLVGRFGRTMTAMGLKKLRLGPVPISALCFVIEKHCPQQAAKPVNLGRPTRIDLRHEFTFPAS
jgi:hypothetical protein